MANYGGSGGGRSGPQWRRQTGTTLPGERTGPELQLINRLRAKAGLPALGGPVGENTRFAHPAGAPDRPGVAGPGGFHPIDPVDPNGAGGGVDPMFGEPGAAPPGLQQGGAVGGFEGPLPNPQQGDLRTALLSRLQGQGPQPGTSAAALYHFLQRTQQQRQPQAGPRRPILPPRRAVSRAY